MKWLLIMILAIGCNNTPKKEMSEVKAFLEKSSLEERAYIVSCLDSWSFHNCLQMYNDIKHAPKVLPCHRQKNGTSILKIAAGTALGIGATGVAKGIINGKSK